MKKNKGSLTLEAALIMPLVIYIVFIMISLTFFIYSRIYVGISINHTIAQATSQWYNIDSDYGAESKDRYGVVANAIGTTLASSAKVDTFKNKLSEKIDKGVIVKIDYDVDVKRYNYLVGEKLVINIKCKYNLPLGGLFKLMGLSKDGTITDNFKKVVMLSNTEDNMRTISYTADLIKRKETQELINKIKSALGGK